AGAVDPLLLKAGNDLRPTGAVREQSVHEDDILRLQRCLGGCGSIEQGKGDPSCGSPDECAAVHHGLRFNSGDSACNGKLCHVKSHSQLSSYGFSLAPAPTRSTTDQGRRADQSCWRRRPKACVSNCAKFFRLADFVAGLEAPGGESFDAV